MDLRQIGGLLTQLNGSTQRLIGAVGGLHEDMEKAQGRIRKLFYALAVVVAVVAVQTWRLDQAQGDLEKAQTQVQSNTDSIATLTAVTNDEVLCPLYGVLERQVSDLPPGAADEDGNGKVTKQERHNLRDTVAAIQRGVNALDCPA